ncbi:ATP-binding cassette domain-containing protein [Polynucleobacter sp. MWH-Braz-FAM2G]|uniref:ATP-binding cassette domain-containing protein n=1 Tax=Polynucleobacter sp. MWH-Braz-FAM2G TaxID=1855883 RepID=UPI001BFD0ECA|nr:ATP-binding cassette domain-containing protein [Polynucleobacter sp. MWH-Braz-FAM2G]QWD91095.1 ATP-binding cassette domain-containing protein [Polynucleobacter sp. MWH-Braz-FAM2G]
MLAASVFIGLIDAVSVALFGPFIASMISPDLIKTRVWYQWTANFIGMSDESPVFTMVVILIGVFVIKLAGATLLLRNIFNFCSRLDRRLRHQLLDRYFAIDLSNLAESSSANIVQVVHGYTSQFSYGLVGAQLRSFTEVLIGFAILLYLLYLNPLALLMLVLLVSCLIIVYDRILKKRIHDFGEESSRLGEVLIHSVQQVAMGIREIRVYGVDKRLLGIAKDAASQASNLSARYQWFQAIPKYFIEFSLMVTVCLLVLLMQHERMPKEEMFALMGVFGVAIMRLTPAANYVLSALSQLRFIDFVVNKLAEALLKEPLVKQSDTEADGLSLERFESIELKSIGFRHTPHCQDLFSNIDLFIRQGDSIGLIGPSGGGKTTLAELILGLRQPTSGEVLINGVANTKYRNSEKFRHFAYIPQQLFIVRGSIIDNVSLLDDGVNVENRVDIALSSAQLSEFIQQLPHGLNTSCGENGAMLSGGQRQRIALARAFYHKRSVLVMDEATSALDYETEKEIIREVRALKGSVTLIVIAHRLETVKDCDRIFRVANGAVVEVSSEELEILSTR